MLSSVKMETHDLPEWNTFYSEASEVKKKKKVFFRNTSVIIIIIINALKNYTILILKMNEWHCLNIIRSQKNNNSC